MVNPVQMLIDEHKIITNAIAIARQAAILINKNNALYEKTIRSMIVFFREYSDRYHHQKEEVILFPEIAKRHELLAAGIITEMNDNHEDFREKIAMVEQCLNEGNYEKADKILDRYTEALLDHIAVEDDELFHAATTLLGDEELKAIYFKFQDCDRDLGEARKKELIEMLTTLKEGIEKG